MIKFLSKSLSIDNSDDPKLDKMLNFKGVRTMLKQNGFTVYHSSVNWSANINTRAEDLRKDIYLLNSL